MTEILKKDEISKNKDEISKTIELLNIEIFESTEPKDLNKSAEFLTKLKSKLKKWDLELKTQTKPAREYLKWVKNQANELEAEIKSAFKTVYQVKKSLEVKTNHQTGEIKTKEISKDNKGQGYFTFTPEKTTLELDKQAILEDARYKHFTKEVKTIEIDYEKLQKEIEKNGYKNLPETIKTQFCKVGIQFKNIENNLKKEWQNGSE